MNKPGSLDILGKTMPFVGVRFLVHLAVALIAGILFAIIMGIGVLLSSKDNGAPAFITFIAFLAVVGVLYGVKRYIMYIIKAGHVSVITEYMMTGNMPQGSQIQFAKNKVKKYFVSTSAMAGVDSLIEGAVRQIMRWLNKLENLLGFIPGADTIFGIINKIIETSCNYIDEAVLSYIYMAPDQNIWKNAADGIVLYAQSWKRMVKAAAKVAFVVLIGKFIIFIVSLVLVAAITKSTAVVIVTALILAYLIGGALIEPFATVVMIRAYHEAIEGQQVSYDLYQKLQGVSSKFKTIVAKQSDNGIGATPTY